MMQLYRHNNSSESAHDDVEYVGDTALEEEKHKHTKNSIVWQLLKFRAKPQGIVC